MKQKSHPNIALMSLPPCGRACLTSWPPENDLLTAGATVRSVTHLRVASDQLVCVCSAGSDGE